MGESRITVEMMITIILFMIGHLGAAVWFAAKINTQVKNLSNIVYDLTKDIKMIVTQDVKIAILDQRILSLEQRIRDIRDLIVGRDARDLDNLHTKKGD